MKRRPKSEPASTAPTNTPADPYAAFDALPEAVIVTDAKLELPGPHILYVNPAFERLTGYSQHEVLGRNPRFLQGPTTNRDTLDSIRNALEAGRSIVAEVENHARDGRQYWAELSIEPSHDKRHRIERYVAIQRDITARKREEAEVRYRANHDVLTGLSNRAHFLERLEQTLKEAVRYGHRVGVAVLDLDRFKKINDTLGHAVGDTVLQRTARRISGCLRTTDLAARFGGDEFAVLLIEPHDSKETVRTLQRVARAIAKPIPHERRELIVTASVGISLYPDDASDAMTLMQQADLAMYAGKSRGRDTVRIFSSSLRHNANQKSDLERRLRQAIKRGQLHLNYQPIHHAKTGKLEGFEALCRWDDPELGPIRPDTFIPLAEQTGQMRDLGSWVLWEACRQAAMLQPNQQPLRVCVNVAPSQFNQSDLVGNVQRALAASGLPPSALQLEITEQTLVVDIETCKQHLKALRSMGVRVAVDDFGMGYSNLVQLLHLPIDLVKLDQTLVREVTVSRKARALVKGIVQLVHGLGFQVLCEGIESKADRKALMALGCDYLQGYWLSPALTSTDLQRYIENPKRSSPSVFL